MWLVVEQQGVDVVLDVQEAAGAPSFTVDSPGDLWGEEWLHLPRGATVEALEIRASTPHGTSGSYRLRVESRAPSRPAHPLRVAAERAVTAAGKLYPLRTREAWSEALSHYRRALEPWQSTGRDAEAARTLFFMAKLELQLDEPRQASTLLHEALTLWRRLGHHQGEAQALMEIANTARWLGESRGAEETCLQALALWRELGDVHGQAHALNYLGLLKARQEPPSALEPYREALALFRQVGDVTQEGVLLNNLGGIYDLLGEPHRALEHFRQALAIHQRLGDLLQTAAVWNNIASVHRRTGRLQEALEGYRASLDARRQLEGRRSEARVLNNMGMTWLRLGHRARALDTLQESLLLRRASGDRRGEAITLHNLGRVHADLKAWEEALRLDVAALALRRTLGDSTGEASSLIAMGSAAGHLGRLELARQHFTGALVLLEKMDHPWRQAAAYRRFGEVLTVHGEPEEARVMLERALGIYRETGDAIGEAETLITLARAATADQGATDETLAAAYDHVVRAFERLETVRADIDNLGLRASYFSRHNNAFELAVDLAMELDRRRPAAGWAARALEISERARARSLLDLLKESGAGLRRAVDPVLLGRQQELLESLNAKVDRRRWHLGRRGPAAAIARLDRETRALQTELEDVENEIRRQSPAWAALALPRTLNADDVRALLDERTTLLEYSLGEERSFLWMVTADRVESFELPGREVIEAAAREVHEGLKLHDPRARRSDTEVAARLSDLVLAPARKHLSAPATERLAMVADGALHYVPFAALPHPADGEPLIGHHEVVSLPSASALAVQRQILSGRRPAKKALAVVADPVFGASDPRLLNEQPAAALTVASAEPAYRQARSGGFQLTRLAWSRWEADAIARHWSGGQAHLAFGFDANLDAVLGGALAGYRVVHFATHGIVESEYPELSALILSLVDAEGASRDGFLRLPEIYNLDLGAELVVLSGCQTALGKEIRGEGLVGLTRGFFAAGARRVVASLWRVQDRSAAQLMDRFYRRLLGDEPMRPAAALRAAQLEMLREPELSDPYHWAAFAVYGDWR